MPQQAIISRGWRGFEKVSEHFSTTDIVSESLIMQDGRNRPNKCFCMVFLGFLFWLNRIDF